MLYNFELIIFYLKIYSFYAFFFKSNLYLGIILSCGNPLLKPGLDLEKKLSTKTPQDAFFLKAAQPNSKPDFYGIVLWFNIALVTPLDFQDIFFGGSIPY